MAARDGGHPIVCLGEALIDFVAGEPTASVEAATTFHKAAGGAPANVAVGLARLGERVAFVGKVADDGFGRFLRTTLEQAGVDVTGLVTDGRARTPLAFVGAGTTTERAFVFYHQGMADTALRTSDLNRPLIVNAPIFHFGSVTLSAEPGRSATLAAAALARDRGAMVSFDPNVRLELWEEPGEALRTIRQCLSIAHLVKVSLEEAAWLSGEAAVTAAATNIRTLGPRLVVVTLGAHGAYYQTASGDGTVEGFVVDTIDSTGAGDAFVAALLAEFAQAVDPVEALEDGPVIRRAVGLANAAGALATTAYGAIPSLPTSSSIARLLQGESTARPTHSSVASRRGPDAPTVANRVPQQGERR